MTTFEGDVDDFIHEGELLTVQELFADDIERASWITVAHGYSVIDVLCASALIREGYIVLSGNDRREAYSKMTLGQQAAAEAYDRLPENANSDNLFDPTTGKVYLLDAMAGDWLSEVTRLAIDLARYIDHRVMFTFNGIKLLVHGDTDASAVEEMYELETTMRQKAWEASLVSKVHVGVDEHTITGNRRMMLEYIIGQCMSCIEAGMGVHQMAHYFIEDYFGRWGHA